MSDDSDQADFAAWFRKNYPGPDTIIYDPDWHAPKIFRAATRALRARAEAAEASDLESLALYRSARERADALKAELDRLREANYPGDLHWLSEDPEFPLECWSSPIEERWEAAGTVFELMAAVSLPHIFVTERVLTVDQDGDPDETEPAWFACRKKAEACYPDSLARARAALKDTEDRDDGH